MNKTIKIVFVLLIAVLLITTLSQACLATNYVEIIGGVENQVNSNTTIDKGTKALQEKAGSIIRTIRNAAAIISVVLITILGIKYMMGSPEEKSGYQKSFIPLIVGIVVVLAATSIATMLFSI